MQNTNKKSYFMLITNLTRNRETPNYLTINTTLKIKKVYKR